jgi:hypothetical protein
MNFVTNLWAPPKNSGIGYLAKQDPHQNDMKKFINEKSSKIHENQLISKFVSSNL